MGASRVVECSWSYVRSEHATSATWGSMASRRPQGRPRFWVHVMVHVGRSSSIRGARSQALPHSLQSYYYCFLRIHTLGSLGTPSTEHSKCGSCCFIPAYNNISHTKNKQRILHRFTCSTSRGGVPCGVRYSDSSHQTDNRWHDVDYNVITISCSFRASPTIQPVVRRACEVWLELELELEITLFRQAVFDPKG